jgi:uncharacterized membrane protein YhfC
LRGDRSGGRILAIEKFRNLEDGVMLGLGHGGIEAMVIGGILMAASVSTLIPMIGKDLSALQLSADQIKILSSQSAAISTSPLLTAAAPLLERLMAICMQRMIRI